MVNEYGSVGGGGPSAGYSGAGGGSPGSSYTTDPLTASGAAAATVTGGNVVAGQVISGSYGNDAAFQAAVADAQRAESERQESARSEIVTAHMIGRGPNESPSVYLSSSSGDILNPVNSLAALASSEKTLSPESPPPQLASRADYTNPSFFGDTQTQQLIAMGLSPMQALNYQIREAYKTPGVRDENYYMNELAKATQNYIATSSSYHASAKATGLSQKVNPYEYVGDLALNLPGVAQGKPMENPLAGREIMSGVYLTGYAGKMGSPVPFASIPEDFVSSNIQVKAYAAKQAADSAIIGSLFTAPAIAWGLGAQKTVSDVETDVLKAIDTLPAPGFMKEGLKVATGFGAGVVTLATLPPLVIGGAELVATHPKEFVAEIVPASVKTFEAMAKHAVEQPAAFIGELGGMYVGGKVVGRYTPAIAERITPIGYDVTELTSKTGVKSTLVSLWTKEFFAPVETATTRAYVGFKGLSEPSMMLSSPSMKTILGDVSLVVPGEIPTFKSTEAAKAFYESQAGKPGIFYHGSGSDMGFIQTLMKEGTIEVTSKKGAPLYFGAEGALYEQFLKVAGEYIPGKASIIRVVETPKSIAETLAFKGTAKAPILPEGLYPGPKGLTIEPATSGFLQEYIIPSGSRISLKSVGYAEIGGSKVPLLDVTIGKQGIVDAVWVAVQQFEYRLNAARLPEYGFGKPTEFIRNVEYQMTNPLEEVAAKQWTPSQKRVMIEYMESISKEPGFTPSANVVLSGMKAVPLFREVKFVQREPVGKVLAGRELSAQTLSDVFKMREQMGTDVVTGGSTTIRASLGKSFIGKELIGDIDAWARAKKVAELQSKEIAIISREQPSVVTSRKPGLQEGFPVAEVRIKGSEKPITEMHSFEAFPAVTMAENVGEMIAIGGAKVRGPTTAFFGGIRKSSATFDEMVFEQKVGGYPEIALNPKSAKHAVGTSAVAKEAASLFYGRDIEKTGMKQSYTKGKLMEEYANSMDKFLSLQKKEVAKTIEKYQTSIEQNPLELPETKTAKAQAYVKEFGAGSLSKVLGVGLPELKTKSARYPSYTEPIKTVDRGIGYPAVAAGLLVQRATAAYPTTSIQEPAKARPSYPTITDRIAQDVYPTGTYPPEEPKTGTPPYPTITPSPTIDYPPFTPPPTDYPPFTPPPTNGYPPFVPPPPTITPPKITPPPTTRLPPYIVPPVIYPPKKDEMIYRGKKKRGKGKRFAEVFSFDVYKGMPIPSRLYVKNYQSTGKRFREVLSMGLPPLPKVPSIPGSKRRKRL